MKRIYYNGTVITMEQPLYADWLCCENGRILEVGSGKSLDKNRTDAEYFDLHGQVLMPSFIDAHSHLTSYANTFLQVSVEGLTSVGQIQDRIAAFIQQRKIPDGQWVTASQYDHNLLPEQKHLSRVDLDEVSTRHPIVMQHKSGHMGVFNSCALQRLGVSEQTPSSSGGLIERRDGRLTGYMEEADFVQNLRKIPMPDIQTMIDAYRQAQDVYFSYGITTIQDGMIVEPLIPVYRALLEQHIFRADVVGFPEHAAYAAYVSAFEKNIKKYHGCFKVGGMKIFLDGSPQGRTAWMRTPYVGQPEYFGYPTMHDEDVLDSVTDAAKQHTQILAHCNGDRACQQFIDAVRLAPQKPERPVMIHAQFLGIDQLDEVKQWQIIPSFFVAHVYHWGDVHIQNFGLSRAADISPAAEALQRGILFTFHQDAPVIEPDMLQTVWSAVCRQTKGGVLLGEKERIDVLSALKAVTVHAAYQYFEENEKGSIRPGKVEDLIVLDQDPLKVPAEKLKDILVLKTIKRGQILYTR